MQGACCYVTSDSLTHDLQVNALDLESRTLTGSLLCWRQPLPQVAVEVGPLTVRGSLAGWLTRDRRSFKACVYTPDFVDCCKAATLSAYDPVDHWNGLLGLL